MKKLIGILALIAMMSGGESLRAQVIAPGHVEGNGTSSARTPTDTALSAILDQAIGSAQGTIAVRGASGWNSLTPGTSGTYLKSNGAGANLSWGAISGSGTVTSIATTSPITGGPITTTGTIGCATCGVTGSPLSQFASTTSAQLAGIISDGTGSGSLVFGTSPSLTTPSLGVATATSINKVAITAPATSATLTIANGKTLTDTSGVGADLLLGATGGGFAAYSGASCTSQVLSGLSATGAANSCVSITNAYLTTGTFASITGTGTLTAGATGAGFTIALGTSTITGQLAIGSGGTGQATAAAAFNALSPMTTAGDIIYGGAAGAGTRLAAGTSSQVLIGGSTESWGAVALGSMVSGNLPLTNIATIGSNDLLANVTSGTAPPTAVNVGSCSAAGDALNWTTNTGPGCNTSITAASVPASGLTGNTLASGVTASSLTSVGTLTGGATGSGFTIALGTSTISGTLGVAHGGSGAATFTANLPLLGNGTSAFAQGTLSGNTTLFMTGSGTFIPGDCAAFDANLNIVDVSCGGGGGGGTPGGATYSSQYNAGGGNFGGVSLGDAQLLIGQTSAAPAAKTMSGDATLADTGAITVTKTNGTAFSSLATATAGTGLAVATGALNLQPAAAATIGGVESITSASHEWIAYIDTSGVPHQSQPSFSDISGSLALTSLATQAANTVVGNATSGSASPTALAMTSCSAAASAVIWTTNTGFGCNTSITANAVPAANLTGSTLASGVTASSLTSVGTLTSLGVSGALKAAGLVLDVRSYGAACDGLSDDAAVINSVLSAAAAVGGGYVIIPSGYTCAFGSTLNLQEHVTLKLMPNAVLKYLASSGDEILGVGNSSLDDRMNIEGPGMIDASLATSGGNVIHYEGGSFDLVRDIVVKGNSAALRVVTLNGNALTGGVGNWRLSRIDGLNVTGTVGDVIDLIGTVISGPTNNSFYNINASNGAVVNSVCIYASRDDDTEYFYNINCGLLSGANNGIVVGSAIGTTFTISSGTYNSTTGLVSLTLSSSPGSNELQTGDTIAVASLTGTGAYASLNGTWTASYASGTTVQYIAATGLGATTITGGNEATTDTDAWGYHFENYILSGGNYGIVIGESHDDSFVGGDDSQGQINPGITTFAGPTRGVLSVAPKWIACHTTVNYNSGYMCADHLPYTVATLPSLGAADTGARAYVTDAISCSAATLTGGGSIFCPVIFNGSAWVSQTLGGSLGVATATSINKVAITAPATSATLTIANGKTLTASNTLTFAGTDSSTLNIGTGGTLSTAAYQATGTSGGTLPFLNGTNTWGGPQTFPTSDVLIKGSSTGTTAFASANASGTNYTWTLPASTDTFAGLTVVDQTLSGGANLTPYNPSAGAYTVDCGKNPAQWIANTGAFTITAPSNDGECILQIENGSGAGAVTWSGFSEGSNTGDALDTTNGHYFQVSITRIHSESHYLITALQ